MYPGLITEIIGSEIISEKKDLESGTTSVSIVVGAKVQDTLYGDPAQNVNITTVVDGKTYKVVYLPAPTTDRTATWDFRRVPGLEPSASPSLEPSISPSVNPNPEPGISPNITTTPGVTPVPAPEPSSSPGASASPRPEEGAAEGGNENQPTGIHSRNPDAATAGSSDVINRNPGADQEDSKVTTIPVVLEKGKLKATDKGKETGASNSTVAVLTLQQGNITMKVNHADELNCSVLLEDVVAVANAILSADELSILYDGGKY